MSRPFIAVNGVDLGLWDSKCMVYEGKVSTRAGTKYYFDYCYLDFRLEFDYRTTKYFFFLYSPISVSSVVAFPNGDTRIRKLVDTSNGKDISGAVTLTPMTSDPTGRTYRASFLDNVSTDTRSGEERFICIYREIKDSDAFTTSGLYFNMYNERGNLAYTYNKPPLSIQRIITKSDDFFFGYLESSHLPGDYSGSMVMSTMHGEESGGVLTAGIFSMVYNNYVAAVKSIFGGGYLGSALWDPNLVLARRI